MRTAAISSPLLSLGITPALQRTLEFERFEVGAVNRADTITDSAAGKGVNVGMALAKLGCSAWVTGFNGGESGGLVEADAKKRGAIPAFIAMRGKTRICNTIIDHATGSVTELVAEAPAVSAAEWKCYQDENLERVRHCSALVISGTVPPSLSGGRAYVTFAREAHALQIPWFIDSHRDDLLAVLQYQPTVAKMNRHELEATFGGDHSDGSTIPLLARRLIEQGARYAFITDGPNAAWLIDSHKNVWQCGPPEIGRRVNPIGSGDCTTAALVETFLRTGLILEAVQRGLACGSANVASLIPADFELSLVDALLAASPEPQPVASACRSG